MMTHKDTVEKLVENSLAEGIALRQSVLTNQCQEIIRGGQILVDSLAGGRKILWAGNGGSAADAQHLSAELIGRFESDNHLPSIALTTDTSVLTAVANDYGFEKVFQLQVRSLMRAGDCLVAISTSGNSPNVVAAAMEAKKLGGRVVGLVGESGGRLAAFTDCCLNVPSSRTCRIQEMHITIGHIWCEMIEEARKRGCFPTHQPS